MIPARLDLALTPGSLEPLVEHIAELVEQRLRREWSPWLDRPSAAAYLGWPVSRLEKRRDVPCYRDEGRVYYRRDELDAWLESKRDGGGS